MMELVFKLSLQHNCSPRAVLRRARSFAVRERMSLRSVLIYFFSQSPAAFDSLAD
jgi:hypothetical protein